MNPNLEVESIFQSLGLALASDSAAGLAVRSPIDGSLLARLDVTTPAQAQQAMGRA